MKPLCIAKLIPQSNQGFSLIEIMIALGIFSIGILAVASMQISAAQGNLSARLRTEAVTLASEELEILISGPYANISSGSDTIGVYNLVRVVSDNSPINGTKTIDITVSWTDRGTNQSTNLSYIKANL